VQIQLYTFVLITIFGHALLPWPDHLATLFARPRIFLEKSQFGRQKSMAIMVGVSHFTIFYDLLAALASKRLIGDQPRST
jgi:hypothetical protein